MADKELVDTTTIPSNYSDAHTKEIDTNASK
jgi:hypothetical protein